MDRSVQSDGERGYGQELRIRFKKSLSRREEMTLKDLIIDGSIVIPQADKGSGVVVLDATDYEEG